MSKAKKKTSESKLRELAEQEMLEFQLAAERRYVAAAVKTTHLDYDTREAIQRMTDLLCRIGRKQMYFTVGGRQDRIVLDIPELTIQHNSFYLACEILKDLAIMDIKIEDYAFAPGVCVECGTEIKPTKKKVKKNG